jgi:hypothetical protein
MFPHNQQTLHSIIALTPPHRPLHTLPLPLPTSSRTVVDGDLSTRSDSAVFSPSPLGIDTRNESTEHMYRFHPASWMCNTDPPVLSPLYSYPISSPLMLQSLDPPVRLSVFAHLIINPPVSLSPFPLCRASICFRSTVLYATLQNSYPQIHSYFFCHSHVQLSLHSIVSTTTILIVFYLIVAAFPSLSSPTMRFPVPPAFDRNGIIFFSPAPPLPPLTLPPLPVSIFYPYSCYS